MKLIQFWKMKSKVLTRLELVTFCVLGRRDNHYTTEPVDKPCVKRLLNIKLLDYGYSTTTQTFPKPWPIDTLSHFVP